MKSRHHTHSEAAWTEKAEAHRARILPWTEALRVRRRRREPHPVYDFLFTYYSHRPTQLEVWHPGLGHVLEFTDESKIAPFRRNRRYRIESGSLHLAPSAFTPREHDRFRWILSLLKNIAARPPQFGCSGLHEWAMLYRLPPSQVRHQRHKLRLSLDEIATAVETNRLACTHFDAFRFFTGEARPLNSIQPERDRMPALEQSGCLHTNMDLYKWAYKLSPWIPSDLVADTFDLARKARELDMRASPYDLAAIGFPPIRIENLEGRQAYEQLQRALSEKAAPLRKRLIEAAEHVLHLTEPARSALTD